MLVLIWEHLELLIEYTNVFKCCSHGKFIKSEGMLIKKWKGRYLSINLIFHEKLSKKRCEELFRGNSFNNLCAIRIRSCILYLSVNETVDCCENKHSFNSFWFCQTDVHTTNSQFDCEWWRFTNKYSYITVVYFTHCANCCMLLPTMLSKTFKHLARTKKIQET